MKEQHLCNITLITKTSNKSPLFKQLFLRKNVVYLRPAGDFNVKHIILDHHPVLYFSQTIEQKLVKYLDLNIQPIKAEHTLDVL